MRRTLKAVPDTLDVVQTDASAPDVLDRAAADRDAASEKRDRDATRRDAAADTRSAMTPEADAEQVRTDRMLAARDRAAAALDRQEAALDRQRAQRHLERSYRDDLTGALQRMAGRDLLTRAVARANRSGDPLVVAFLDVDYLKARNDREGHASGDNLLRAVAAALRTGLRSYDIVVRYGGDEFVCALPDSNLAHAVRRFEAVRLALGATIVGGSFSIGLAELLPDEDLDHVIARADQVMYATRRASRG